MAPLSIDWPCTPVLGGARAEEAVVAALRPPVPGGWASAEGRDGSVPEARLTAIEAACTSNGMQLKSALSLRRHIIMSQEFAEAFERVVAAFLREVGASFQTEEELRGLIRTGQLPRGPTPDVLFDAPGVYINGRMVRWLDCKAFYGSCMLAARRGHDWIPVKKLAAQEQKYAERYGPGGFVFARGFGQGLRAGRALLLDATPLDMSDVRGLG